MNKLMRYPVVKIILIILVLLCTACGIKIYIQIDPPTNAHPTNLADGTEVDPTLINNFSFTSADVTNLVSSGTDIYYRIYTNQEDLQKDANIIKAANIEDSTQGYNKLVFLKYERMLTLEKGRVPDPIIGNEKRTVTVILASNNFEDAKITTTIGSTTTVATPIRNNGKYFNFDSGFNSSADYKPPNNNDSDVFVPEVGDVENGDSNSHYFVNLYAVSVGSDQTSTWIQTQSQLLSLGFLYYEQN